MKLWIILIPMMNLENRQTYIRKTKKFNHTQTNKRLCSKVKKKRKKPDAHSFCESSIS